MAQFNIPLAGGGQMRVNASDYNAALSNVQAQGGTPAGGAPAATGASASDAGGGSTTPGVQQGYNSAAAKDAITLANNAAQAAYNTARLALDSTHFAAMDQQAKDQLAFDKAKEAWSQTFQQANANVKNSLDTANVTGVYTPPGAAGGSPALQQYAPGTVVRSADSSRYGVVGPNGTVQPAGDANNAAIYQALQRPGSVFTVPEDVFSQGQSAGTSGGGGQLTLAAQAEQNKTSLGYLDLMSRLQGPANAFNYAKTLAGTPQGLTNIVDAAAGRYQMGGAPSGAVAAPASLNNLLTDVNNPSRVMAGGPSGGVATPADPNAQGLPMASQIDSRNYNLMLPSQKDLLWGAYQYGMGPSGAMTPADAQAMYANSLPRYAGPNGGSVNLKV